MSDQLLQIPEEQAEISKLNTRQPKPAEIAELIESIRVTGQLTPAIVRPHPSKPNRYEIAAGACRKVACKTLKIPLTVIVRNMTDKEFEDCILVENLQRTDPDPLQEALFVQRRIEKGETLENIASSAGKSINWVRRRLKLIGLSPAIRELITTECAHFSLEMQEFLGSLPEVTQEEIIKEYHFTNSTSLADLKDLVEEKELKLDNTEWMTDPQTFLDGCTTSCAHPSDQELFPSETTDNCAVCLNGACFKKRRQTAIELAIDAAIGTTPITKFIFFGDKVWNNIPYKDKEINVLSGYVFQYKYKILKKPTGILGLDITNPLAPKIVHLKLKESGSATNATSSTDDAANPADPNQAKIDRLRAKRAGALVDRIVEAVSHTTFEKVQQHQAKINPIYEHSNTFALALLVGFGANHHLTYPNIYPWEVLEKNQASHNTYRGGFENEDTDDKKAYPLLPTTEIAWERVQAVLVTRLKYNTLSDCLVEYMRKEMEYQCRLLNLDIEALKIEVAKSVTAKWVEKEKYDNFTLTK